MGILQYFVDMYLSGANTLGTSLNHLLSSLFLTVLFSPWEKGRGKAVQITAFFVFSWFVVLFWGSVYYWLLPESDYGYLITPLPTAMTMALACRCGALMDRVLRGCMYVSVTTLLTAIVFPVLVWERQMFPWNEAAIFEKLIRMAIALPIFISLRRNRVGKLDEVSPYFPVLMVAISMIGYLVNAVSVFILKLPPSDAPFSFNFFFSIGLLAVEFLAYFMFYWAMRDYNEKRLMAVEQQRVQGELEMLRSYERSYDRVGMVRHDIQNHYAYVGAMLERGEYESAIEYFKDMNYLVEGLKQNVYCEHRIINLALNLAGEKAAVQKTRLDINVSVPARLNISDVTLTSILTNLLDNSIEAVKEFEQAERVVKIAILLDKNYLLLHIVNPVREDTLSIREGRFVSTKRKRSEHGFGTQIVQKYAETGGGCAEYRVENGEFIVDVMLRNAAEGEGDEA